MEPLMFYITTSVIIAHVYFKSSLTLDLALMVFRCVIHFENQNVVLFIFSPCSWTLRTELFDTFHAQFYEVYFH